MEWTHNMWHCNVNSKHISYCIVNLAARVGERNSPKSLSGIRKRRTGRALRLKSLLDRARQPLGAPNHCSGVLRSLLAVEIVARAGFEQYFEGACGFLEIPKIQKNDSPKIPRFHADPKLLGNPNDSKIQSSRNNKIPRGSKIAWRSYRFKKLIVPKYQDSTRIQKYGKCSIPFPTIFVI